MSEVIEGNNALVSIPTTTPMRLLEIATEQGADLEKLQKLMDLQERWEKREAEKAFVVALAGFKENPPEIVKNKLVSYTGTSYKHASLDEVVSQTGPALSRQGLSTRWNVRQEQGRIVVTCILQHIMGHAESVTMDGLPDDSGKKNGIQQAGSTVTYLQRYTLMAVLGLAAKDQDTDGRTDAGKAFGMGEEAFQGHLKAMREAKDTTGLQGAFTKAWKEAGNDQPTKTALLKVKDECKGQIMGGAK